VSKEKIQAEIKKFGQVGKLTNWHKGYIRALQDILSSEYSEKE